MRKCAAILCAAVVTITACACGKDSAPTQPKTSNYHISTTTTTIPTMDYTEDSDKTPLNLVYATAFSDGVALVRYRDSDGVEHEGAINTEGELLFDLPEGMPFEGPGYKDGIRVVNNIIYDKTGAVIASPELSGYDTLITGSCGGYVLAKKTEIITTDAPEEADPTAEATDTTVSTTGSTATVDPTPAPTTVVSVGVLNAQGEWKHPLSTDHPIAKAMAAAVLPGEVIETVADGVLRLYLDLASVPQYYHFANNTLTADYVHYASFPYTPEETAGIYKMATDGTKKMVIENVIADYFFADAFIGRSVTPPSITETEPTYGTQKLYDFEGKELMDLSAYTLSGIAYYQNGYLTFPATDEVGSRMLVVLGPDGQQIMDPVMLGMRDHYFVPDATGFVLESYTVDGTAVYRHYDYEGNVTFYENVTSFTGLFDGLAAVTLLGDADHYYYINYKAEIVLR